MTSSDMTCRVCQEAEVRIEKRNAPRRLGDATPEQVEVRVCTSRTCPSNTSARRLGDAP
jgi:hypothetical protein